MELVTRALLNVVETFIRVVTQAMTWIELQLRDSLSAMHVSGTLQSLIVAIVPILFLALALKLMGGVLRIFVILVLLLLLVHVMTPIVQALIHGG